MEVVHQRCAGLDISKKDAKLCVRTPGSRHRTFDKKVTVWGSFSNEVQRLREHLIAEGVSLVVMEATGDYWKPFLYRLQDCPFEVMLVNARHAKNLPGRKTDVSDAQWLAELGAHGLVRASFVPPEPVRELRQLTRSRTIFTAERARESQRLEKLLEDSGIKLSSVATQITGVSGRAILAALIAGERDPAVLAELAKGRLRVKIPALVQALTGTFTEQHAFMATTHLDHIDRLTATISTITARIATVIGPFQAAVDLLVTMPGVSQIIAEIVIAETGADMSRFPTAAHLASWAGVCPGHNESAGRIKSTRPRPGNSYLKGALGIASMAAARTNGTFFQARYRRLAVRRGEMQALVAVEHSMITAIWHMLSTNKPYHDLGHDHFDNINPGRERRRAIAKLTQLGYDVTLTPTDSTA
jgi:transposase